MRQIHPTGGKPGAPDGDSTAGGEVAADPVARISLLDVDRDLAGGLTAEDLAVARRYATADVIEIPKGSYNPRSLVEPEGLLGLLVISGLLVRRVAVGDRHCGELVGGGAVLRPWDDFGEVSAMPFEVRWRVIEPVRLARLDRRFLATIRRWPSLIETFTARVVERSHTLAFIVTIHCLRHVELRLLAFLWHLADRFGRVTSEGTHIPLRLTHSALAELVGAARPSTSVAMKKLSDQGLAWRRADGTWMLTAEPPGSITDLRLRTGGGPA